MNGIKKELNKWRDIPKGARVTEGGEETRRDTEICLRLVQRFASVEAFKIVTPNTIFQSDFMIMMMWISLSVYIKKLSIASAC